MSVVIKFSPMRDWWPTPLEWLSITCDLDLDLGSSHMAYGRASLIDLYLYTKFHWNGKNFIVDGLTAGIAPSLRSRDTKTRTNIKNPARSNLDIVLYLRISGHLPAAIVNGGGDRVGKVQFSELHRRHDLDLESGHTAYRHASVIDLYVHTKFHWNRTNFLWTDAWMDRRTYWRTDIPPLMLLGRLLRVHLIIQRIYATLTLGTLFKGKDMRTQKVRISKQLNSGWMTYVLAPQWPQQ